MDILNLQFGTHPAFASVVDPVIGVARLVSDRIQALVGFR